MTLHRRVAEPVPTMRALFAHYLEEYQDWEPFLG
jgi:hypothetical protein